MLGAVADRTSLIASFDGLSKNLQSRFIDVMRLDLPSNGDPLTLIDTLFETCRTESEVDEAERWLLDLSDSEWAAIFYAFGYSGR